MTVNLPPFAQVTPAIPTASQNWVHGGVVERRTAAATGHFVHRAVRLTSTILLCYFTESLRPFMVATAVTQARIELKGPQYG
ncbi:MAG: hypothetical protein JO044_05115 [Mycobacteriaceae bacterium]|nr:hypothetical protein [Mycobacteriaceae bacterium]MBV9639989.1 hypothetical protein [Mycobacteriaceae bacterium]